MLLHIVLLPPKKIPCKSGTCLLYCLHCPNPPRLAHPWISEVTIKQLSLGNKWTFCVIILTCYKYLQQYFHLLGLWLLDLTVTEFFDELDEAISFLERSMQVLFRAPRIAVECLDTLYAQLLLLKKSVLLQIVSQYAQTCKQTSAIPTFLEELR